MTNEPAAPLVLLVEDDDTVATALKQYLTRRGFRVEVAGSLATGEQAFAAHHPSAVVLDYSLPDGESLPLLARFREIDPTVCVLVLTGHATVELAVRAVKGGAETVLTKPVDLSEIDRLLRRGTAVARPAPVQGRSGTHRAMRHRSLAEFPAMREVLEHLEAVATSDCNVLILGETGTGKSMIARYIHTTGARKAAPFVDVNCAALSRDLVESELFGHAKGAFTGAHAIKPGLLEAADGGTLFLDEIGDIDVAVQPKILKVLEEKTFRRVGEVKERTADVRLISATHKDLSESIREKTFRSDLYYRIATFTITVPPLRQRKADLPLLSRQIIDELTGTTGSTVLAPDAEAAIVDYAWPGNVRELRNVLERSLVTAKDRVVRARDLRFDEPSYRVLSVLPVRESESSPLIGSLPPSSSQRPRTLGEIAREHIIEALVLEQGRVELAAKRIGIPRSTLYQRLKEYGIVLSDFRNRIPALGRTDRDEDKGETG